MGAYRREALRDHPHWHIHCFVHHATFDPVEQQWKAGQLRSLIADKGYLQEHFHTLACATIDGVRVQAPANERRNALGRALCANAR